MEVTCIVESFEAIKWFTAVVAVLGVSIAWYQANTAKNRLKMDLFDRRFPVYEAVDLYIQKHLRSDNVSNVDDGAYMVGISGSRWLFDRKFHDYLTEELWDKASEFRDVEIQLRRLQLPPDQRSELLEKKAQLSKYFAIQSRMLDEKFKPYLSLSA